MACPYMGGGELTHRVTFMEGGEECQQGVNKVEMGFGQTYPEYLQVSSFETRKYRSGLIHRREVCKSATGTPEIEPRTSALNLRFEQMYSYSDRSVSRFPIRYLQLDKILTAQKLKSEADGQRVDDEHLFIVIHQAHELWFKQIIFDLDIVRKLLNNTVPNLRKILELL